MKIQNQILQMMQRNVQESFRTEDCKTLLFFGDLASATFSSGEHNYEQKVFFELTLIVATLSLTDLQQEDVDGCKSDPEAKAIPSLITNGKSVPKMVKLIPVLKTRNYSGVVCEISTTPLTLVFIVFTCFILLRFYRCNCF